MRIWIAVPLALLSLSACRGNTTTVRNTTPTAPLSAATHRTAAACVLVRQDGATNLFGRSAQQVAVQNAVGAASICGWRASTNPDPNAVGAVTYSLLVDVYDDTTHYSEETVQGAKHLDGIGEKAFMFQAADLLSLEFVYRGQMVSMRYSITSLLAHQDSGASSDQLVALAKEAVGRM